MTQVSLGLFLKFFNMPIDDSYKLDAKIAWKLAEGNNQLHGMGDLNVHITVQRQASKHSQTQKRRKSKELPVGIITIRPLICVG